MKKLFILLIDTFIVATLAISQPTITSFNPISGKPGDVINLIGTNFNITTTNNIVFFGATRASVITATSTSLTVTVPTGATYSPITVLNSSSFLMGYSLSSFNPIYTPAKINITSTDFAPKVDFATGNNPYLASQGDIDGDGKPDLIVANDLSNTVSVLRNNSSNGNITFAPKIDFATGNNPYSVSVGDIDLDGKLDLVVENFLSNSISILRNTSSPGNITFAPKIDLVSPGKPSVSIADIDGDGKPDLVVTNFDLNSISVFPNMSTNGNILFANKIDFTNGANMNFSSPRKVSTGDFDGDGKVDIAVVNFSFAGITLLRNVSTISNISFSSATYLTAGAFPNSAYVGDLDGDGKIDLSITNNQSDNVSIFRNTSTLGNVGFATKQDFSIGSGPIDLKIGDIDGNGKPDLVVANSNSNNFSILINNSSAGIISFPNKTEFATGNSTRSVSICDFDGDSKPDLAVTKLGSNTISLYRNTDIALPFALSYFEAKKENNSTLLQWGSTLEINVKQYELEKSYNGLTFKKLATIPSKGYACTYFFIDVLTNECLLYKTNYYRLKLVNSDDTYSYSSIKTINFETSKKNIIVYPNPTKDRVIIVSDNFKQINIYNCIGKLMCQKSIKNSNEFNVINTSYFPKGVYFVEVVTQNGGIQQGKFVKE